jgi:hypothetical protein
MVLERDGHTFRLCGAWASQVDHITERQDSSLFNGTGYGVGWPATGVVGCGSSQ